MRLLGQGMSDEARSRDIEQSDREYIASQQAKSVKGFSEEPFKDSFLCCQCGLYKPLKHNGGTGYGKQRFVELDQYFKICYQCIGENEYKELANAKLGDKFMLYLIKSDSGHGWQVTNWPGSFKTSAYVKTGRHNIARTRYDSWFFVNGKMFHGVTFGDDTQIHHVKAVKPLKESSYIKSRIRF